jgi:hypothetical protein
MKLLNYDKRTLIMQNVRSKAGNKPTTFTMRQYEILCRLIQRKQISKQSFDILLDSLYGLKDWRKLNYEQMYELIHVLTYWDYEKVRL